MKANSDRNPFRVIDTGVGEGRWNIAFDQALIELRRDDRIADTLRFLQFQPTVLLGRHQIYSHSVDAEYCGEQGIGIGRRVTGGGALYLDEQQLGWELVFARDRLAGASLDVLTRSICEAAASGLSSLGVDVRFRPRNDLEVDGRKLGGTGGFFDGPVIFFQGTVLLDVAADTMLHALRIPVAKLAKHGAASPADRLVGLRELLGRKTPSVEQVQAALIEGLGTAFESGMATESVSAVELEAARTAYDEEIGKEDFVRAIDAPPANTEGTAVRSTPGGEIAVWIRLTHREPACIESVLISGDFFVTPPRAIRDLEAGLKDAKVFELDRIVQTHLARANIDVLSVDTSDLAATILEAAQAAVAGRAA